LKGWHRESYRHALAARGIKTRGIYTPGITELSWTSSDGFVESEMLVMPNSIDIYDWHSSKKGEGRTIRALQELRDRYPGRKIYVHGIGVTDEDPSWKYWVHMARKGHEDVLLDDGGGEIYVER